MATDPLIKSAILLGDVITASGKEQWLFPTINITCSATVTALRFLAEIEGNGRGMRNKYPQLQVWRPRRESEYTKAYSVSDEPSLVQAHVYGFSGLSWSVQAGDVLGMYQPDLKKSKYTFIFQQNGEISTYRLSNQRNAPRSFTLTNREVHSNLQNYPLVAIETNNPLCVSGFLKSDDLISKGELLSGTNTNRLVEHHDQLRLIPGMRFGCGGTITKCIFAAKRRDIEGQQTYPHLQIWQKRNTTSSDLYVRRSSIALGGSSTTPHINVFEVTPTEPLEFSRGDILGLYLPPASQNPLILGYQHYDSSDNTGTRSYVYQQPIAGHRASIRVFPATSSRVDIDYDTPMLRVEITIDCGAPESPTNGNSAATSTVNGSMANYTCNTGYSLMGVKKRVCLESNGTWSNELPTCHLVDCGLPPMPHANSQLNIDNTTYGSRATYTCGRGFQPSSAQPLKCNSNGEWSGSIPTCEGIQCSRLSAPQHGDVQIIANKTDTQLNTRALYTCNSGYSLDGESSRICQENEHWTGTVPDCIADCSQLGRIRGGSVVLLNSSTAIGSVVVYSCNKRMKMVGNKTLICREDSTWSSNPPVCEPIQCDVPTIPVNGRVSAIQNETMLDAVVEYSCKDGFFLEGNKTRVCQQDERWSGLEPRCIKGIDPTVTLPIESGGSKAPRTTEAFGTESSSSGDGGLVTLQPDKDGLSPKGPKLSVENIAIIAVIATLVGIIILMISVILLLYVRRKKQHQMEVDTIECTLQQDTSTSVDNPVYEGDQHLSFNLWNTSTCRHQVEKPDLSTHRNPVNRLQVESKKESTENLHYHVSTIAIPDVCQHYEFADIVGSEPHYDTASNCGISQYEVPVSPYEIPTPCHKYSNIYGSLPWGTYVPTEEQRKSILGSSSSSSISPKSLTSKEQHQRFFTESEVYWRPASDSASLYEQLARNKYREILRKQIQTTEHLGSGHFGNVDQGLWQSPAGVIEVAIKTLKQGSDENDKVKFLQEAAINGQFRHENVVKLHGVVTVGEPVMMILELLPHGDLRNYLVRTKPVPGEMVPSEWPELLLKFCQNIASGMEYLSMKAFIHRDLAARNILVAEDKTCKISDFGLSRDLEDESYYISHGGKIPVKWTAPEALHFKKYSTASDVWSFGAVMYEIWSLGHKPFESFSNIETITLIDRGYRLQPPPGCPRAIYQLMIQCWHPEASVRPNVSILLQELKQTDPSSWYEGGVHTTANMLGAPLEASKALYLELQQRYSIQY